MWKYFTAKNTNIYLDKVPDIVNKYNNTKHNSIKMAPKEASRKIKFFFSNLCGLLGKNNIPFAKPKCKI